MFEIAQLQLNPGDILVVRGNGSLSAENCDFIKARIEKELTARGFVDVGLLVIDTGLDLAVMKKAA